MSRKSRNGMLKKTLTMLSLYGDVNSTETHEKFRADLQNAQNNITLCPIVRIA